MMILPRDAIIRVIAVVDNERSQAAKGGVSDDAEIPPQASQAHRRPAPVRP
jgi:hypothetical protein